MKKKWKKTLHVRDLTENKNAYRQRMLYWSYIYFKCLHVKRNTGQYCKTHTHRYDINIVFGKQIMREKKRNCKLNIRHISCKLVKKKDEEKKKNEILRDENAKIMMELNMQKPTIPNACAVTCIAYS